MNDLVLEYWNVWSTFQRTSKHILQNCFIQAYFVKGSVPYEKKKEKKVLLKYCRWD